MFREIAIQVIFRHENPETVQELRHPESDAQPPHPTTMVDPTAVAKRFWAYGTLGKTPDDDKWHKLDADVREVALNMSPDEIGQCMWALGTIRRLPSKGTWTVLEIAVEDTACRMSAKSVAVTVWAYARLKEAGLKKPDKDAWAELETAVEKHANENAFANEDLVNIAHAFATLPRVPPTQATEGEEGAEGEEGGGVVPEAPTESKEGDVQAEPTPVKDECWDALELAIANKASEDLTPTEIATTLWVFRTMHTQPKDETWHSLDQSMVRIAPGLKGTLQLAQMTWSYHSLNRAPEDKNTRWLMHNAVLLQPMGLQRVGVTRESNGERAKSRMETRDTSQPAAIDAHGWLKWAMHEPPPALPAKHALTFDPDAAAPKDDEENADAAE